MAAVKGMMRQVEEKYAMNEIEIIVWSNKIDLLALSNAKGEVALHRLNWQRVWLLSPPLEDAKVTALAWRPDGRIIVASYTNREVLVVDIERKVVVHKITLPENVCFLQWSQESTDNKNRYEEYFRLMGDAEAGCHINTNASIKEPADLPMENFRNIKIYSYLNFMLVGLETGEIRIYVFGLFCCGSINVKTHLPADVECTILSADISQNLKTMVILANIRHDVTNVLRCIVIDTKALFARSQDLYTVAYKRGTILNTINNIGSAMVNIIEAHEHIVIQEMQMQIFEYSKDKEKGTLSAEFMELLLFGFYSPELVAFLRSDLSDKKLKKISSSIEVSHSNILKQIVQHLRPNVERLLFELSIMLGLGRLSRVFPESRIIIDEESIYDCMTTAGAFSVKANKVLHVLDDSSFKYKSFFRWLASATYITTNERIGNTPYEVNQREMNFICDYLCKIDGSTPIAETDELAQYLGNKEIQTDATDANNLWCHFLAENPCLERYDLIIPRAFDDKSLVQIHKKLVDCADKIFTNFTQYVKPDFPVTFKSDVFASEMHAVTKVSVIEAPKKHKTFIAYIKPSTTPDENQLVVMEVSQNNEQPLRTSCIYFGECEHGIFELIDMQFYSNEVISLLLNKRDCMHSCYIQLPIENVQNFYGAPPQNVFSVVDKDCLRMIENMKSLKFAVSGPRNVSVIVADDGHRVRIFEMEADDDEESGINATSSATADESHVMTKSTATDYSEEFSGFEGDMKTDMSGPADDSDDRIQFDPAIIDFGEVDVNSLSVLTDFADVDDLADQNITSSLDCELERNIAELVITPEKLQMKDSLSDDTSLMNVDNR